MKTLTQASRSVAAHSGLTDQRRSLPPSLALIGNQRTVHHPVGGGLPVRGLLQGCPKSRNNRLVTI